MTPVALQPQIEAVSERPTVADLHAIGIAIAKSGVRNVRRHWIVNAIRSGVLLIVDVATLLALRFAWTLVADGQQAPPAGLSEEFLTGWSFPVALVMGLAIAGAYGSGEQRRSTGRVFAGVALAGLFALYPALWAGAAGVVGYQLTRTVILLGTALRVARWCADRLVDRFGPILGHRVIVVGSSDASGDPPVTSSRLRGARVKVVGWVGIPDEDGHDLESPAVRLAQMIHERQADTVIIRRPLQDADFTHVIDQALASGCLLLAGSRATRLAGVKPRAVWFHGESFVELTSPHDKGRQLILKRTVDLLGALLGLTILSPLFALLAIWIKLDSPGPVLFGHERLGVGGRTFRCFKFRSMCQDAEQILRADPELYGMYLNNHFKMPEDEDSRITRVGRFLRRTSLDELPQLLNVVMGQMSLVGPRPIVEEELEHYGHCAALFLSLKPGMTGVWAVNGRSKVGYPDRVDMELQYIRRWSLVDDLSILAWTIPAVLRGGGAH